MKNLIDSLTVFSLMIIGGFIGPFMDDSKTDSTIDTEG